MFGGDGGGVFVGDYLAAFGDIYFGVHAIATSADDVDGFLVDGVDAVVGEDFLPALVLGFGPGVGADDAELVVDATILVDGGVMGDFFIDEGVGFGAAGGDVDDAEVVGWGLVWVVFDFAADS